jgi:hypothetical protein
MLRPGEARRSVLPRIALRSLVIGIVVKCTHEGLIEFLRMRRAKVLADIGQVEGRPGPLPDQIHAIEIATPLIHSV